MRIRSSRRYHRARATKLAGYVVGDTEEWLATLPATPQQRRLALAIGVVLLLGFGIFAPFADRLLPRLDAFIPSFEAIIFVTDFITSVLLFAHFSINHSRALLALANGYLFTALIVIPHPRSAPLTLAEQKREHATKW